MPLIIVDKNGRRSASIQRKDKRPITAGQNSNILARRFYKCHRDIGHWTNFTIRKETWVMFDTPFDRNGGGINKFRNHGIHGDMSELNLILVERSKYMAQSGVEYTGCFFDSYVEILNSTLDT